MVLMEFLCIVEFEYGSPTISLEYREGENVVNSFIHHVWFGH